MPTDLERYRIEREQVIRDAMGDLSPQAQSLLDQYLEQLDSIDQLTVQVGRLVAEVDRMGRNMFWRLWMVYAIGWASGGTALWFVLRIWGWV